MSQDCRAMTGMKNDSQTAYHRGMVTSFFTRLDQCYHSPTCHGRWIMMDSIFDVHFGWPSIHYWVYTFNLLLIHPCSSTTGYVYVQLAQYIYIYVQYPVVYFDIYIYIYIYHIDPFEGFKLWDGWPHSYHRL